MSGVDLRLIKLGISQTAVSSEDLESSKRMMELGLNGLVYSAGVAAIGRVGTSLISAPAGQKIARSLWYVGLGGLAIGAMTTVLGGTSYLAEHLSNDSDDGQL